MPWLNEPADGADTIEWIASASFCDGTVGMVGDSSLLASVDALAQVRGSPGSLLPQGRRLLLPVLDIWTNDSLAIPAEVRLPRRLVHRGALDRG